MKTLFTFGIVLIIGTSAFPAFAAEETVGAHLESLEWGPPAPASWGKNNLHLIEADRRSGFAIYRTSNPDQKDMRKFCELGITEMMVLSGNAEDHEFRFAKECPTLKVIYNEVQDDGVPLDRKFLSTFDAWVASAKQGGKKIAFRCECGCHRTGRLAAYYQMKYQALSLEDAKAIMTTHGKWMAFYPHVYEQVDALHDFVEGVACSTRPKACVKD